MSFMQHQVTKKIVFVEIDGAFGTTWIPAEDAPEVLTLLKSTSFCDAIAEAAAKYYEGSAKQIENVTLQSGHGARLSAPGYLDCTEWSVFDTVKEAEEYLDENYPEDDEDEDGDSNT